MVVMVKRISGHFFFLIQWQPNDGLEFRYGGGLYLMEDKK